MSRKGEKGPAGRGSFAPCEIERRSSAQPRSVEADKWAMRIFTAWAEEYEASFIPESRTGSLPVSFTLEA